jgi:hypothetical protein
MERIIIVFCLVLTHSVIHGQKISTKVQPGNSSLTGKQIVLSDNELKSMANSALPGASAYEIMPGIVGPGTTLLTPIKLEPTLLDNYLSHEAGPQQYRIRYWFSRVSKIWGAHRGDILYNRLLKFAKLNVGPDNAQAAVDNAFQDAKQQMDNGSSKVEVFMDGYNYSISIFTYNPMKFYIGNGAYPQTAAKFSIFYINPTYLSTAAINHTTSTYTDEDGMLSLNALKNSISVKKGTLTINP